VATAAPDLGEHRYADLGDVRLHYVEKGEGPLVVLLHGFPEFWFEWREQIPALAAAGFRVVAPDMRGYNLSSKPSGIASYKSEAVAKDIADLIRHLGEESAVLVGHDWGAAVAWFVAMEHPEVVKRLVIVNVPHPKRMLQGLRTPRQIRKSWYMFFFQLPFIPEKAFAAKDFAAFRKVFKSDPTRPYSDDEIARYVEAWRQPGALTGMLNYYRAAFQRTNPRAARSLPKIEAPVMVIWGKKDTALGSELAEPPPELVPNVRMEWLPEASHWSPHDEPEKVSNLLIDFAREDA
jgi:pimeloyl-ACP methyl ester carboxylesterase